MSPSEFMDKVLLHWPPFRWTEEQERAWSEDLVQEVHGFSAAIRKRASETMVRSRPRRAGTPGVADCVAACVEAKRWIDIEEGKTKLPLGPADRAGEWEAGRLKLAYDLCNSDLGRQAAKEGWLLSLWNFCRVPRGDPPGQRHPKGAEIEQLKKQADDHRRRVIELHAQAEKEERERKAAGEWVRVGDGVAASLASLGESMLTKQERMAKEVLGKR